MKWMRQKKRVFVANGWPSTRSTFEANNLCCDEIEFALKTTQKKDVWHVIIGLSIPWAVVNEAEFYAQAFLLMDTLILTSWLLYFLWPSFASAAPICLCFWTQLATSIRLCAWCVVQCMCMYGENSENSHFTCILHTQSTSTCEKNVFKKGFLKWSDFCHQ